MSGYEEMIWDGKDVPYVEPEHPLIWDEASNRVIEVLGGIPSETLEFAHVGGRLVERDATEDEASFRERVLTVGRASNETVVFGGLPPMATEERA